MWTMSDDRLKEYLELYSKYVDLSVKLHNYHYDYVKYRGFDTSTRLRSVMRKIAVLQKHMRKACLASYREHRQNHRQKMNEQRLEQQARKLARLEKKENKNGKDN